MLFDSVNKDGEQEHDERPYVDESKQGIVGGALHSDGMFSEAINSKQNLQVQAETGTVVLNQAASSSNFVSESLTSSMGQADFNRRVSNLLH